MKRWMGIPAIIVFGCAGIGSCIGSIWVTRALERTQQRVQPPMLQFSEQPVTWDRCGAVDSNDSMSMEQLGTQFEASAQADFRAFVRSRFSCLGVKQQQAFAGMLRVAAVGGDTTAQIAIDAITRTACTTLHELGGVSDADRDGAIDSCVVAMPRADGTFGDSEREPSVQARTMRFAQLLPLVAAGTASPMATEHFCADYTVLPFDAQLVLTRGQPKLPELLQRYCSK